MVGLQGGCWDLAPPWGHLVLVFFAVLDDFWGVILGMLRHPKVLQAFPEDGNFIPLSMQHSQLLTQLWEGNPVWIQLLAEGKGESDPTAKTNQGQTRPITPRSRWHWARR